MANDKTVPAGHTVRGRELTAPKATMKWRGRECELRFDLNAFRIAEDVYADEYGKDKNFAEIALELTKGRLGAIMAMYYAALVSGGEEISWPSFQAEFQLTDIPGVRERLTQMVADALPEADPGGDPGPLAKGDEVPEGVSHGNG